MSNLNDHAYSQGWWRWETDDLKDVTWWWQVMRYRGAKSYQHPSVTGQWSGMLPWQQSHKAGSRLQTGQDRMMGMERYLMLHVTAQNRHTHTHLHTLTHKCMWRQTCYMIDGDDRPMLRNGFTIFQLKKFYPSCDTIIRNSVYADASS